MDSLSIKQARNKQKLIAFFLSIPIGYFGGLIGLGGAEFRLPVLISILKKSARDAVPINLTISLITVAISLLTRRHLVLGSSLVEISPVIISMIVGSVIAATLSVGLTSRISNRNFEKWVGYLLILISILLLAEGLIPFGSTNLKDQPFYIQSICGGFIGLIIGMVSSTLGVAGGELIIPSLIFIFGIGVKTAGSASLLISLPTISIGLVRYYTSHLFFNKEDFKTIIMPMGLGSVAGSILGGVMVGVFPAEILKIILGFILIISAVKILCKKEH